MPTAWSRCSCLPSLCSAGAIISSARLNSAMSRYPQVAIDVRKAPMRLNVPSFSSAGPVMIGSPLARAKEAPGRGFHWGMATFHNSLPRGARIATKQNATLEEILLGPAMENDGSFNLFGALRTSMATCGYADVPSFHRAEVMIAPALQTEGKQLQREQHVGMGSNGKAEVAAAVNELDE